MSFSFNTSPIRTQKELDSSRAEQKIDSNKTVKSVEQIATTSIKLENDLSPPTSLKSSSPIFTPKSQGSGHAGYFTYFMSVLKRKVTEIIPCVRNEKILANEIKKHILLGYEINSIEFFLCSLEICTTLPKEYKNLTWKYLVEHFETISFEKTCPFAHAIQVLTFKKVQSFDLILSFINTLSVFYEIEKSDDTEIRPIEMSFNKAHPAKTIKPERIASIHLKLSGKSLTLAVPSEKIDVGDISTHFDLVMSLLPKLKISSDKNISPSKEISKKDNQIKEFAKAWIADSDTRAIMLGFHLLVYLYNTGKIGGKLVEESILNILPLLLFNKFVSDPKELLIEIQKLKVQSFSKLHLDLPDTSSFYTDYISFLLETKNYKGIFNIYKNRLFDFQIDVELALKICESSMDHKKHQTYMQAFLYWKEFSEMGLFELEADKIKEHQFIQQFLCNISTLNQLQFGKCRMELYPKLFERPLSANLSKKFHIPFFNYLRSLSSFQSQSKVSELILLQSRIQLTKNELDELKLLGLESQEDEKSKMDTLVNIDKNNLDKESKEIISNLSKETCHSLIEKNQIDQAVQIAIKLLYDDEKFLSDLLKTILKGDTIQNVSTAHQILHLILNNPRTLIEDRISLLEMAIPNLNPFSKELKITIKKNHLKWHQELIKEEKAALVFSLFISLAKLFNLNELYPKNADYWLDIIKGFEHGNVELQETVLKYILNQRFFTTANSFNVVRVSFHQLVKHYFDADNNVKAIALLLEFLPFESESHEFDELVLSNTTKAIDASITAKDSVGSLTFLNLLSQKNKLFKKDEAFINHVNFYLSLLFERKEYSKWIQTKIQFGILDSDVASTLQAKEAVSSILGNPSSKKNYDHIFTILRTSKVEDVETWKTIFKHLKEKNLGDVKHKVLENLKKNPDLIALYDSDKDCMLYVLEFLDDLKDSELLYNLLNEHTEKLYHSMQNGSSIILSIIGKVFRSLKSKPLIKEALIKKLFVLHSKVTFADSIQNWKASRLLIDNCFQGDDKKVLLCGAIELCTLLNDLSHSSSFKELVPALLQILAKWPVKDLDFTDGENKFVALDVQLYEAALQLILANHTGTTTYFEQYQNLICHPIKNFQLFAFLLYRMSIVNLQVHPEISSKSLIERKHELIQMAFESDFLEVQKEALELFVEIPFQMLLKNDLLASYAEKLINKLLCHPLDSFKQSEDKKNICALLIIYLSIAQKIDPDRRAKYMKSLNDFNDDMSLLTDCKKQFLYNHEWIFSVVMTGLKQSIQLNKPNTTAFKHLITMLNQILELLQQNPDNDIELHAQANAELMALLDFHHLDEAHLLDLPIKNFLFANDKIWNDHKEAHLKFVSIFLKKLPVEMLPTYFLAFTGSDFSVNEEIKLNNLVSLTNSIDKKTPLAIITRILRTLMYYEKALTKDKSLWLNLLNYCFTYIQNNDLQIANDVTLGYLMDSMYQFVIDGSLSLNPELKKCDRKKVIAFCFDYMKTMHHLINGLSEKDQKVSYLQNMLIFDTALRKSKIPMTSEEQSNYISEFFKFSMPFEKESDDHVMCLPIFRMLLEFKTDTKELRIKKQELIIKIINHYIELATMPEYVIELKSIYIHLLKSQFHQNFGLMEENYRIASDLITKLQLKVTKD